MRRSFIDNEKFGLKEKTVQSIQNALSMFPSIDQVILYGSRAKGNYRTGSDIDLTIKTKGTDGDNLLFDVMGALDDLDLIYQFDVSIFDSISNENLVEHINRVGVTFYDAKQFSQIKENEIKKQEYFKSAKQSEQQLEDNLIKRLNRLGYDSVNISSADELRANLKAQLTIHNADALNGTNLSDAEFAKVLNHLDKSNVFARAKNLRDRFNLIRDDGSSCYLRFLNTKHWCQNQYQVTNQVTIEGSRKNRYDVTLLVNGLPLVQIELKRRGVEIKEAFNQVNRYQRDTFWAENGLFQYVQLFVISNGVNSKYFANNRHQEFKQTFYWAKEDNELVTQLDDFADVFLEKCHLSKMICKYIVLHESDKILMVLRPYQFYAVEAIVERVKDTCKNGYIWHTTGSGKTLTSYKAAQILTALPTVHKVVFVVDRADLDYQTTREFNFFSDGCVDGTNNTKALVKQMAGESQLIVTTIQKLNTAISKDRHESAMAGLKDKRVVFIFDECHRSQFGETHKRIVAFFNQAQMFGFTGTPIFKDNSVSFEGRKRTTKDLFQKCLHKYLITHAIADDNVLKFAIEYWGKLKRKDGSLIDEKVPAINIKEFFESEERIEGIVDWVIAHHARKTHNKQFSAMMCVSSVDMLNTYYDLFKQKKEAGEHDLRVVTIFTYNPNEADVEATGETADELGQFQLNPHPSTSSGSYQRSNSPNNQLTSSLSLSKGAASKAKQSREKLEACVEDYNAMYQTQQTVKDSKGFYTYYKDIAKRMKERDKKGFNDKDRADILLVVNMFLTGFDAKKLNTLYVDKNLQYHGLIQAFSRTNRILGELKSQGNIVCFRNLKQKTDEAITLFSDINAKETVLMEPYEVHVADFNNAVTLLREIAETPNDVNALISEDNQVAFVKAFRNLMRILNKLQSFTEFSWRTSTELSTSDLDMSNQEFEDYKSKYLDIYERSRKENEGVSIIEEVDFELELIHKDEINVAYILQLLANLQKLHEQIQEGAEEGKDYENAKKNILDLLGKETQLRSKRELIEQFINDYMPTLDENISIEEGFNQYWDAQKQKAIEAFCAEQKMDQQSVMTIIDEYNFTGKEPLRDTVFLALEHKPKLMERKHIFERFILKLKDFIHTFEDDLG
ncbi:MAG TPA: HsdR family type I site-specific deoxyribonuclease [Gammaproteobacteria bacterium]|nr:HsdR family type I site-specific deoxyribonuclease [Gammaproteobacteria bacterium]